MASDYQYDLGRRRRIMRLCWSVWLLCILITAASIISCRFGAAYVTSTKGITFNSGIIFIEPSEANWLRGFFVPVQTHGPGPITAAKLWLHPPGRENGIWHIPLGLPTFVIVSLVGLFYWKARRIKIARFCKRCSYDLSGAAHTCCPECGMLIQEMQKKAIVLEGAAALRDENGLTNADLG